MNLMKTTLRITHDHVAALRDHAAEQRDSCSCSESRVFYDGQVFAYEAVCNMLLKVILDDDEKKE